MIKRIAKKTGLNYVWGLSNFTAGVVAGSFSVAVLVSPATQSIINLAHVAASHGVITSVGYLAKGLV